LNTAQTWDSYYDLVRLIDLWYVEGMGLIC
jgi:hypothetical protein